MGGLSLRGKYARTRSRAGPLDQTIAGSMEAQGAHYYRENLAGDGRGHGRDGARPALAPLGTRTPTGRAIAVCRDDPYPPHWHARAMTDLEAPPLPAPARGSLARWGLMDADRRAGEGSGNDSLSRG
jgi:hypothetical protein